MAVSTHAWPLLLQEAATDLVARTSHELVLRRRGAGDASVRTEALKLLGHFVGLHEDARQQVQDAVASLIDDVLPVRSWELPKGTTQAPLVLLRQVLRELKVTAWSVPCFLCFTWLVGSQQLLSTYNLYVYYK